LKKILFTLLVTAGTLFGYNFSGTWLNQTGANFNDPVKLVIKGSYITPYIIRGDKVYKLKQKKATNLGGRELYEAWGFGYKNLVLLIKPINSNKIKVIEKKIYTKAKRVITKSFIFKNTNKVSVNRSIKKRFIGNWIGGNQFSALSRLAIRVENGKVIVKAWRPSNRGDIYMGQAVAILKNGKLHTSWQKGDLFVNSVITGYNYNEKTNRYNRLKVDISAKNLANGLQNWQTLYLVRAKPNIAKPMIKHLKVGPVDINLLIKSY